MMMGAILVGSAVFAGQAAAETQGVRTLSVTGIGSVDASPDKVRFVAATFTVSDQVESGAEKIGQTMAYFSKGVQDLGIDVANIESEGIKTSTNYKRDKKSGNTKQDGYRVRQNVTVTNLDPKVANQVVEIAVNAGMTNIQPLIPYSTRVEELRKEALQAAMDDAMDSAKVLAEAGGFNLGRVINLRVMEKPVAFDGQLMRAESHPQNPSFVLGEVTTESRVHMEIEMTGGKQENSALIFD